MHALHVASMSGTSVQLALPAKPTKKLSGPIQQGSSNHQHGTALARRLMLTALAYVLAYEVILGLLGLIHKRAAGCTSEARAACGAVIGG